MQAFGRLPEELVVVCKRIDRPVQNNSFLYVDWKCLMLFAANAIGHKIANADHLVVAGQVYMRKEVHTPNLVN